MAPRITLFVYLILNVELNVANVDIFKKYMKYCPSYIIIDLGYLMGGQITLFGPLYGKRHFSEYKSQVLK